MNSTGTNLGIPSVHVVPVGLFYWFINLLSAVSLSLSAFVPLFRPQSFDLSLLFADHSFEKVGSYSCSRKFLLYYE
eukprot:COSAG02_NODE_5061_length_4680_cov_18.604938_2_plen_76_part_00